MGPADADLKNQRQRRLRTKTLKEVHEPRFTCLYAHHQFVISRKNVELPPNIEVLKFYMI